MSAAQPLIFLGVEVFELLVLRVPNEVLRGFAVSDFDGAIGTSRERYEFIVNALREGGRTQCFIGQETAGYLRNALSLALLQLDAEFQTRTGSSQDEALEVLQSLAERTAPVEAG